jgi:hypothetical protein
MQDRERERERERERRRECWLAMGGMVFINQVVCALFSFLLLLKMFPFLHLAVSVDFTYLSLSMCFSQRLDRLERRLKLPGRRDEGDPFRLLYTEMSVHTFGGLFRHIKIQ